MGCIASTNRPGGTETHDAVTLLAEIAQRSIAVLPPWSDGSGADVAAPSDASPAAPVQLPLALRCVQRSAGCVLLCAAAHVAPGTASATHRALLALPDSLTEFEAEMWRAAEPALPPGTRVCIAAPPPLDAVR